MDSITMGTNSPLNILLLYDELREADLGGNGLPRFHDFVGELEMPRASPCDIGAASVLMVVVYKGAGVAPCPIPQHQSMQPGHSQRGSGSAGQ